MSKGKDKQPAKAEHRHHEDQNGKAGHPAEVDSLMVLPAAAAAPAEPPAAKPHPPPATGADQEAPAPQPSREQLQDQFLRLQADFDNYRKRMLREKNEISDRATQDLMLALLPVLDHLDLGFESAAGNSAGKEFSEGLRLIQNELMNVLAKSGLSAFDALSQPFDPNRFEAIGAMPSASAPEGTVIVQTRRGYLYKHALLRPAQVVVSSGPPAAAPGVAATEPAGPAED